MHQFIRLASSFSSPAILITVVWCLLLIGVAIGPIDYPTQPSWAVLALVASGVSLFVLAYGAGNWCCGRWSSRLDASAVPQILNIAVAATSLIGLAGIGLIALDRTVLSGVSNAGYTELLRCAPTLVEFIEIKRTPLLYVGYLTFSFGFASLVLFLLKGDEIRGWPAALAQLSVLSPVGYTVLYSGRMPVLLAIVLIVSAVLVRIGRGQQPLPLGHHLFIKLVLAVLLFGVYSTAMWSSRQKFCNQAGGMIQELQQRMRERDPEPAPAVPSERPEPNQELASRVQRPEQNTNPQRPPDMIRAGDLNRMVDEAKGLPETATGASDLLRMMQESWQARPRSYVVSVMESGRLSPDAAKAFLSTYFYLTHGIRVIDMTWRARDQFSPHWGVYEVGILSPILRVFLPESQALKGMDAQLKSAGIYGFFPTVWAAAYIDFGTAGAVIYILIWGFAAGCSAFGTRHSALATPSLLLVFVLASIFLSSIQGPLGIANSALVLFSMIVAGAVVDLASSSTTPQKEAHELKLGEST